MADLVAPVGWAFAALAALGVGLLSWAALDLVGDTTATVARWWRGPWARLRQSAETVKAEAKEKASIAPALLTGAGVVLALLARDPALSPWMLALGGGLAWWQRGYGRRHRRRSTIAPQTLRLLQLLGNYMRDSVTGALSQAAERMDEGPVREAVEATVRAHFAGAGWTQAVHERLVGLDPLLDRLALLLAAAPQMEAGDVRLGIEGLIGEVVARQSLEAEAGAELILLKLTVRFLAIANVVAVVAALVIPAWRDFFVSTLGRRGTFVVASTMGAAAYVYFSEEIAVLEGEL